MREGIIQDYENLNKMLLQNKNTIDYKNDTSRRFLLKNIVYPGLSLVYSQTGSDALVRGSFGGKC